MAKYYSRRATTEEKRNKRKAFLLTVSTIGLILALFFFGIPLIVKYAGLLTDLKSSSAPIEANDTTAPPPPRLDTLPEATNNKTLDINGSTEPGATVTIFLNNTTAEVLANKSGRFSYEAALRDGENDIQISSKDTHGNESQKTPKTVIIFDDQEPELEITSPEEKDIYGSNNKQITIQGKTEPKAAVTINDRLVIVGTEGNFSYIVSLSEGENKFTIKSEDIAGNATEETLTLNFSQ